MVADVTVYYITGRQVGALSVPHSWCRECDLTVEMARRVLAEVDPGGRLSFQAKPWLRHALEALRLGGWHAPVLVVDGRVHSQGAPLRAALRRLLAVREPQPAGALGDAP